MSALSKHIDAWSRLPVSGTVLEWVENGIQIPFTVTPDVRKFDNHILSKGQNIFIDEKVTELFCKGYISHVHYTLTCVSPIGCVSKKGGKLRLITDLRYVNTCCETPKFRYEDISTLPQVVQSDKLVTLDLKDGFYHVPIHEDYRKYLGFCWKNKYYVWNVLLFGLQCSPYYFCKYYALL